MVRLALFVAIALALAFTPLSCRQQGVKIGSKKFTESVILGDILHVLTASAGTPATHYRELGGTRLVYQALQNGDIDVYPEYTGTLTKELFAGRALAGETSLSAALAEEGIRMSRPLGFNNTYALGMLRTRAEELAIRTTSDLRKHPDLRFGFSSEFLDRGDGWASLRTFYGLPQTGVRGLDHDVAYRQLQLGQIDVIDVYTTDAKIAILDLAVLDDDRAHFPRYDAVLLYRADLADEQPTTVETLLRLEGALSEAAMVDLNRRVEAERIPESRVAAEFVQRQFGLETTIGDESFIRRLVRRTVEHLDLVRRSLIPAILIAIPLGILAARRAALGQGILGVVGIVQTIPALALLVMLMPPLAALGLRTVGAGTATAVAALFLYSLLPIVRNTYAGLHGIPREHQETARALGLSPWHRLTHIEMPLASRSILAGIKTAAVLNVGFATLGALIGAGGYGQPIITGIRLADTRLILEGAIPAALLALLVQGLFDIVERSVVPKGLRLRTE